METFGRSTMSCEQVEAVVFELERADEGSAADRAATIAHLATCPKCAALQESWHTAKEELLELAEATSATEAPERVEMQLRQEFRARQQGWKMRHAAVAAWALAAAAVLIGAVSAWNWQRARSNGDRGRQDATAGMTAAKQGIAEAQPDVNASAENAGADELAEFTPLPGIVLDDAEEKAILRVRMQRSSLGALGLPVNEQRASDWIQVDLLVGNDGLPQGVRLAQEEN